MLTPADIEALKASHQDDLLVNEYKSVFLLKVPKFVADKWRGTPGGAVVGVAVPNRQAKRQRFNETATGNNLDQGEKCDALMQRPISTDKQPGSASAELLKGSGDASEGTQDAARFLNDGSFVVVASGASGGSHFGAVDEGSKSSGVPTQVQHIRNLRTLKIQTAPADNLYFLSYRAPLEKTRSEKLSKLGNLQGCGEADEKGHDVNSLDACAGSIPGGITQNVSLLEHSNHQDSASDSPVSRASTGIKGEAIVAKTVTLVPTLNQNYCAFIKDRHEAKVNAGRATQEMRLGRGASHLSVESSALRLFRYYRGETADSEYDGSQGGGRGSSARRQNRPMTHLTKPEPGTGQLVEHQDQLKQKLFAAFESPSNPTRTLGLQDILRVTGASYHHIKPIISKIAVPVRGVGERRKVVYKLKPEFSS